MNIIFTGKIDVTRKKIEVMCKGVGITLQKSVTNNTNVLFVGVRGQHFINDGYGTKSTKEKAALEKGIKIEHIESIDEILEYFV